MARYRLIAVDLDGTLLTTRREVSEENRHALAEAAAAGVRVAVVTGRRFPSLLPFVAELPFDPLVVANSGAIVRAGREGPILRSRLLDLRTARLVLTFAGSEAMEPVVHDGPDGEGRLILQESARDHPVMGRYLKSSSPEPRFLPSIELRRSPVQVGFTGTVGAIRSFEARLLAELDRKGLAAHLARTEYPHEDLALLDVLSPDATKGKGLEFVCAHLGIDLGETMAIGDNWNDLDMLEAAGLGIVMGNASEELRARGFAQTTSNDEAGVARAIDRYLFER